MAFEIETKDCTAVTDAELGELEAVAADSSCDFSMGLLSKQAEEWVLLTTARENDKLRGYVFYTLERIGGTPAVVMGLASVERNNKRATTLRSLMSEVYHRALMAFPDEDVVFGTQFINPGAFEVFTVTLNKNSQNMDIRLPAKGAWGTRFAKRLGVSSLA